jgi:GntR family transcriptional regulator
MLPFTIALRAGEPVIEQVVYAVWRALMNGQLRAGDPFPSVRDLSQALKINPNTAHRIVAILCEEGALHVRTGVGTVLAIPTRHDEAVRTQVLTEEAERLVVNARRSGVSLSELLGALRRHWSGAAHKSE